MFNMLNQNHTYSTRAATYNLLDIRQVWTPHLGEFSVTSKASKIFIKIIKIYI